MLKKFKHHLILTVIFTLLTQQVCVASPSSNVAATNTQLEEIEDPYADVPAKEDSSNGKPALAKAVENVHADIEDKDRLEKFNRPMFHFNMMLYKTIVRPIVKIYKGVTPEWFRNRVSDFNRNLGTPVIVVNNILQGDKERAFTNFWRFTINTSLGFGGIFDIANEAGLVYSKNDFGLTLARRGVTSGTYLMLPFIGPTNLRDGTGMIVDAVINPLSYVLNTGQIVTKSTVHFGDTVTQNSDLIDNIDRTSLDSYVTTRSLYQQNRNKQVSDLKNPITFK
jgi:phospholipid-binding lipoprotein MlaA